MHGTPGSRLEVEALGWDTKLLPLLQNIESIRLISVDRPGIGLSSYYEHTPKTFAENLLEFVKELNIKRVVITGLSGGGIFALACAGTCLIFFFGFFFARLDHKSQITHKKCMCEKKIDCLKTKKTKKTESNSAFMQTCF